MFLTIMLTRQLKRRTLIYLNKLFREKTKHEKIFVAGLIKVKSTKEAENLKNEIIEEIEEIENMVEYEGKEQDKYGYFREVYILKENNLSI